MKRATITKPDGTVLTGAWAQVRRGIVSWRDAGSDVVQQFTPTTVTTLARKHWSVVDADGGTWDIKLDCGCGR